MFSEKIEGWKNIMAGFAIFGFVLSFILGLIGGVIFGVVLLRAFLFSALFAGLSLAIMKIIENFIPEFLGGNDFDEDGEKSGSSVIIEEDSEQDSSRPAVSGRNLDITIDDEDEGLEPVDSDDDFGKPADDSEAEEMEELESADDAENPDEKKGGRVAGSNMADEPSNGELPDIGVYSDSFEAVSSDEAGDVLSSIDGSGSSGSAEILGDMHETQEIVKAVKTVLKKDQEG